MAQKIRFRMPFTTYHTWSCGHNRMKIFKLKSYCGLYLKAVWMTQQKYDFELVSYCLTDTRMDMVIRTKLNKEDVSRIMQFVKARFTEMFNELTGHEGTVWDKRFQDIVIDHEEYPEEYLRYLLNKFADMTRGYRFSRGKLNNIYNGVSPYFMEKNVCPLEITLHKFFMTLGDTFRERVGRLLLYSEGWRELPEFQF